MATSMYLTKKKKRAVDLDAPPRPTLLGHEKEMKHWREQFGELADRNVHQTITIKALERKVNRLEAQLDALSSYMKRNLR